MTGCPSPFIRNGAWRWPPRPAVNLIFADPDNGIRAASHQVPAHRTKAVKYAYLDELAAFARRGQSLVVYHHADRTAPVEEQARRRLADIAREVPIKPVAAVRASRGTTRLFLVAATPSHADYLTTTPLYGWLKEQGFLDPANPPLRP